MTNIFSKDSSAVLDYKFDWAARTNGSEDPNIRDWLASGETISDFSVSASPVTSGCVVNIIDSYLSNSNTSVTVWVGGGDKEHSYYVYCQISTSSSPVARTDKKNIRIDVT